MPRGFWSDTCVRVLSRTDCFNIITSRNKVVAKVIFLHLFVILFTWGSASVHGGILPPQEQNPSPLEQTPPTPPGAATPQEQTPPRTRPPGSRHPLGADTSPGPDPPGADTPLGPDTPPGSRLQHTVYERPTGILLECILVFPIMAFCSEGKSKVV